MRLMGWLRSDEQAGQQSSVYLDASHYEHLRDSQYSTIDDEERSCIRRRIKDPRWTIDRGAGRYKDNRAKLKKPSLVETGKHAGRSRVVYAGVENTVILKHIWKRDFFGAAANASFGVLILALVVGYVSSFVFWAVLYYIAWSYDDTCFIGFVSFQSAILFAIETQQTIGFGVRAPGDCWTPAYMMAIHSIWALFTDSLFLGIIFAKISLPKNRSRTILISDCAVIARRDGVIKFMFRVADIRKRSVIAPVVKVALYRWGGGHTTAEGEHIPVDVQDMRISFMDSMLLLPVTIEHTVDETSPLHGCSQQSLELEHAEVVVTFEGTNEFGDQFMCRRSYLPSEVFWGHVFVPIIHHAPPGHTQHSVDLSRFHDVEPQRDQELMPPSQMSKRVLMGGARSLPPPSLGDNTLVLSNDCVVASRNGQMRLMFRLGDTRPGQMLDVRVRAFLIRWQQPPFTEEGEELPYTTEELRLTTEHPLLRYPAVASHPLAASSPIRSWTTAEGMLSDADAEVVVTVEGVVGGRLVSRSRSYDVLGHVKWGFVFAPCVVPPSQTSDSRAWVDWARFHSVLPLHATSHSRRLSAGEGAEDPWTRGSSRLSDATSPNTFNPPDPRMASAYSGGSGYDAAETAVSRAPSIAPSTSSWTGAARNTPTPTTTLTQYPSDNGSHAFTNRDRDASWHQTRSLAAVFQQFNEAQHMGAAAAAPPPPPAPTPAPPVVSPPAVPGPRPLVQHPSFANMPQRPLSSSPSALQRQLSAQLSGQLSGQPSGQLQRPPPAQTVQPPA